MLKILNFDTHLTSLGTRVRKLRRFIDFSRVVLSRPMIGPFATRYFSHLFAPSRFATSVIFAVCCQLTVCGKSQYYTTHQLLLCMISTISSADVSRFIHRALFSQTAISKLCGNPYDDVTQSGLHTFTV